MVLLVLGTFSYVRDGFIDTEVVDIFAGLYLPIVIYLCEKYVVNSRFITGNVGGLICFVLIITSVFCYIQLQYFMLEGLLKKYKLMP